MAQGWIEIIPRKGTFVVKELPEIKPIRIGRGVDLEAYAGKAGFRIERGHTVHFPRASLHGPGNLILDDGLPDTRLAPIDLLIREYRSVSQRAAFKKYLWYGGPRGAEHLLETLSGFLNETRGIPITTENLLITRGAQMAFYLATLLIVKAGDNVIVGEPGYLTTTLTFHHAGATIHRVPVDDSGIDVDRIESLCRKKTIRLVYVIPHHHYPTTVALTPDRRIRLLELAARYRFAIIEDDYDYDFDYNSRRSFPWPVSTIMGM